LGLIGGLSARQFNSCLPRREDEDENHGDVVTERESVTVWPAVSSAVSIQYANVTDRQTPRGGIGYAYA